MHGYDPSGWQDLFTGVASASAALAGLLFVAISINLKQILALPVLPARAASALGTLVLALVVSILMLVPGQHRVFLGAELIACAAPVWLVMARSDLRNGRSEYQTRFEFAMDVTFAQLAVVPIIVGGVSLIAGAGGGLYWLVPALVFVFITTAVRAWVLLVEIMR